LWQGPGKKIRIQFPSLARVHFSTSPAETQRGKIEDDFLSADKTDLSHIYYCITFHDAPFALSRSGRSKKIMPSA